MRAQTQLRTTLAGGFGSGLVGRYGAVSTTGSIATIFTELSARQPLIWLHESALISFDDDLSEDQIDSINFPAESNRTSRVLLAANSFQGLKLRFGRTLGFAMNSGKYPLQ